MDGQRGSHDPRCREGSTARNGASQSPFLRSDGTVNAGTARSVGEVWQTQIKVWNEEPPELWRALYLRLWVKRRHCESEEAAMTPDAGKQKDTYERCGKD